MNETKTKHTLNQLGYKLRLQTAVEITPMDNMEVLALSIIYDHALQDYLTVEDFRDVIDEVLDDIDDRILPYVNVMNLDISIDNQYDEVIKRLEFLRRIISLFRDNAIVHINLTEE